MAREVTQADWLAYNVAINESSSKAVLKEELMWIRDHLTAGEEGIEEGGMKLVKKPK